MIKKLIGKPQLVAIVEKWRVVDVSKANVADFWHEMWDAVHAMPDEPEPAAPGTVVNNNSQIVIEEGIVVEHTVGDVTERLIYVGEMGIRQYNEEQCVAEGMDTKPPVVY